MECNTPGLEVIKLEYHLKLKIKRNHWLLADTCPQAANHCGGAQWVSGRVLDSRPRGRGFDPHWRHCVVVLEQDTFFIA